MALQNMSESVYVGMCHNIGTPQQVAARRDTADIWEFVTNKVLKRRQARMRAGSRREGFRFVDSDVDIMFWQPNQRVIWDFDQSQFYNIHRQTLILCDVSESPPGFALLWLPLERADYIVLSACLRTNGRLCISSSKYREIMRTFKPDSTTHGPCSSGKHGIVEYDIAHCFVSEFWPPSTSSWINRCYYWPPSIVVNEIVRNGCHFVAIGHTIGNHADNEWRISFSQAEYKLVCSMNHTQFLTYGLLKLFLKEIINKELREGDKLLCSYHMKTVIFWAIQQNSLPQWCPQNLLIGLWVCFKLLLKWVYEGVCPNFFIPQNNMFLSKIHGQAQTTLFRRLYELYEKGIALLLHSSSIGPYIHFILCNPRLGVYIDEYNLVSDVEFDVELFTEIEGTDIILCPEYCVKTIHTVEQLIVLPLTQYHVVMLKKHTATILQYISFTLNPLRISIHINKQMYISDRISRHMLKLATKFGFVSDLLYVAMYYYKTFRYRKALSVIELTKVKLAQPYLMYWEHVNRDRYSEAVGGRSWSTKMTQAVARDIKLSNRICYIKELIPEQQSNIENQIMFIPLYVLLHMLEFLCSRYDDIIRAQTALDDLQVLVHHKQDIYIAPVLRDISWEILGICQQITGNLHAALYSYQQSLRQYPYNKIQNATRKRICDIHIPNLAPDSNTRPLSALF